MRNFILTLALLITTPALAGSLTFQVTDATDGTVTKTFSQFSDANITRWIAANQSACNVSKNGTCTRLQVLNYIITNFVSSQVSLIKQYEQNDAASAASAAVTPIEINP